MSNFVENLVLRAAGLPAGRDARPALGPEAVPLAIDAVPVALGQPAAPAGSARPAAPARMTQRRESEPQAAIPVAAREVPRAAEPRVEPAAAAPLEASEAPGVPIRPALEEHLPAAAATKPATRVAAAAARPSGTVTAPAEPQAVWAEIRPAVVAARLPQPAPAVPVRGATAEPPPVEVHIDSIEVRAPAPPPPPAPAPARPAATHAAGFDGYQRIRSYRGWDRVGGRS